MIASMDTNGTPARFIVTCMGHSGSAWLAKSLNFHPEIVCSHAFQPPPFSIHGDPAAIAFGESVKGEDAQLRHDEGVPRVKNLPLDKLFEELICYADGRAYGNVHMYFVRALLKSVERFPPSVPIQVANLIRHPVPWVESRAGSFAEYLVKAPSTKTFFVNTFLAHGHTLLPFVKEYGLDLNDPETLGFLAAAADLAGLIQDIEAWPDIWFVKMEILTRERESFAHFVKEITAGAVTADPQYLDRVFSTGKENSHSRNSGMDTEERYASWPEWQKQVFLEMSKRFNISGVYKMFGYDFGFLGDGADLADSEPAYAAAVNSKF